MRKSSIIYTWKNFRHGRFDYGRLVTSHGVKPQFSEFFHCHTPRALPHSWTFYMFICTHILWLQTYAFLHLKTSYEVRANMYILDTHTQITYSMCFLFIIFLLVNSPFLSLRPSATCPLWWSAWRRLLTSAASARTRTARMMSDSDHHYLDIFRTLYKLYILIYIYVYIHIYI